MVAEVWIQSIAVFKDVDINVLLTQVAFMGGDWGCHVADTGDSCQLQKKTHCNTAEPIHYVCDISLREKRVKKHSVERSGRKSEKSQSRCQDQEDEEVQLQGREHTCPHCRGISWRNHVPWKITLQQIFPRRLSLIEATCTGAGKKYEEEGKAQMKCFALIANPAN